MRWTSRASFFSLDRGPAIGAETPAYIQQWGSAGGSTTLLNTEGVLLAYRPLLLDQSTLAYRQHGFAEPLHCGRTETSRDVLLAGVMGGGP